MQNFIFGLVLDVGGDIFSLVALVIEHAAIKFGEMPVGDLFIVDVGDGLGSVAGRAYVGAEADEHADYKTADHDSKDRILILSKPVHFF